MFEARTEVLVDLQQFLGYKALTIWWVHYHYGRFRVLLEILDVATLYLNALSHHRRLHVAACASHHAAVHVIAIDFVLEFTLL